MLSNHQIPLLQSSSLSNSSANYPTFSKIKTYLFSNIQSTSRNIYFHGQVHPPNFHPNLVNNTKYNLITFLPLVLYNQFKFFINLFFLCTALSQIIPALRIGLIFTYIGPLTLVLSLTMIKQAYDDYKRHLRDLEANSKIYRVVKQKGYIQIKSSDLKVGDIIEINGGNRIPADMVLLYSDEQQGTIFLKTDQLDGQTDWKLRKAVKITQNLIKSSIFNQHSQNLLINKKFNCEIKAPSDQIYNFEGIFSENDHQTQQIKKQKLTLQNTMWANTVLANGRALGLVVYTGKQSRISLGTKSPRAKFGILDWQINLLSKILFFFLFSMTLVQILLLTPSWKYLPISFFRILILLSSLIPISMRVNLDFAKLVYSIKINKDKSINGTIARNSNIPEQLGRIKYLLTDKTGTLTQNEMLFKKISLSQNCQFTNEQVEQIKQIMRKFSNYPILEQKKKRKQLVLKQLIYCLVLCHNVTPIIQDQKISYQGSSPDQITFVKMVQNIGIKIIQRSQIKIKIQNINGDQEIYEIIYNFPFTSDRKRMGILLYNQKSNQYIFYLKGADIIMKKYILDSQNNAFIDQKCKDLAMIGLRTLVVAQKILNYEQFITWKKGYQQANNLLDGKLMIQKCIDQLQKGAQFLGITGVQDKLQQDIKETLENIRNADIKIWMLTGDKIQTAECIGISSGITQYNSHKIKIQNCQSVQSLKQQLKYLQSKWSESKSLVIDGKSLSIALDQQPQTKKLFFQLAMKLTSVLCCRCSPTQKAQIVQGIKLYNKIQKDRIAAIGDGGNDVAMIQSADVGLGIFGKQGKQAALAADYSIQKFKYINKLFLWHGRLSYKRSALLSQFIMHRGLIISIMQMIFSCVFYFVEIPLFNSLLNLGYSTIFTFWPVFSLIFDQDIDKKSALQYPQLYASLQKGSELTTFTFLTWVWKAVYQGSVIFFLTIVLFNKSYLYLQTICFSVLIITQYCMSLSQLHQLHVVTIICVLGSLTIYILCLIFLKNIILIADLQINHIGIIVGVVAASWGPIFLTKILRKWLLPTDYQKVMKNVKKTRLLKNIIQQSHVSMMQKQNLENQI